MKSIKAVALSQLSEALLDFTSVDDLQAWLDERSR
ncbi:DUF4351 domain-containing protein [Gloeocapsa sp. PCC 7428]